MQFLWGVVLCAVVFAKASTALVAGNGAEVNVHGAGDEIVHAEPGKVIVKVGDLEAREAPQ
ncbi:hypothetical protein BO94DRAFT_537130 [Aspergillus sclerotioniger CBS 115572]|uniref:Uncharacterized protein n=1 Tax=Aspergillus sclerotioniger CBS 115572 TaxID=1450535 RepID=A0A317W0S3_9EURO|nr:hypothetical protein BO94DRAFT_537130 [Aspergillus sclerotioniger CBS 115572]PWY80254.1 hypothetical protein BO94DRAFT_537130 [Aspergillus sclerotioniger CBS 115572]